MTEELINYFDYVSADIEEGQPFGVKYTVADCPWNAENKLTMITSLYIQNIALISKLSLDFSTGLTVLSGETGSGKSFYSLKYII